MFKATFVPGSRATRASVPADYWVGFVTDRAAGKVVWMDNTITVYGPTTTENLAFYSMACLAEDMAAGRLLYAAVQQLMNGKTPCTSTDSHVSDAIKEAEDCYKTSPTDKKFWLECLEGCISAADAPGNPFIFLLFTKTHTSISSQRFLAPRR